MKLSASKTCSHSLMFKGATLDAFELLFSDHNASCGHVALCQIAGLLDVQLWCERHDAISAFDNCV